GTEPHAWLRADEVRLDLSAVQLLTGCGRPSRIEARGVALELHRKPGGAFAFGGLLRTAPRPAPAAAKTPAEPAQGGGAEVAFHLVDSRIMLLDEPTGTELDLTGLEGHGTWRRHHSTLEHLTGLWSGGRFELDAELVRGAEGPMFEAALKAR